MTSKWEIVRLGDVFESKNTRLGTHDEEPPVFSISKYDGVVLSSDYHGKRVASTNLDTYKVVDKGDWAYSTIHIDEGSIARNKQGFQGVVSPMYTIMRWTSNAHSPSYFELLLTSSEMLSTYGAFAQGSINRRKSLPWKAFSELEVFVPPLAEQRRIVDLIGALDDAIVAAEDAVKSVEAVSDRIANEAYEKAMCGDLPLSSLLEVLGQDGFVQTGPFGSQLHSYDYVDVGTPVVMPTNIKNGAVDTTGIARITDEMVDKLKRHVLRQGDIVWSRRGDVTRFAHISSTDEKMICGTGCLLIRPTDPTTTEWLTVWLSSKKMQSLVMDRAVGATMLNLNTKILGGLPVVMPEANTTLPDVLAAQAVSRAKAEELADSLRKLRSELLTALLSGAHTIPDSYDDVLTVAEELVSA